jgi:glycosyltransferase involved in cell wall biosynthesis
MKKICFVVPRYHPIVGGTEKLCQEVLEFFQEKNSDIEISVITQASDVRNKFDYKYKIYDCAFNQFHLMKEHFEIFKYDLAVFFADLHTPYLNYYDVSWSKKNICILNLDETTYGWKDNFSGATRNLKLFDKVITFTKKGIANRFLEENNIKSIYIPNFSRDVLETESDTSLAQKLNINKSLKTILYNAAYETRKNQLNVLKHINNSKVLKDFNWIFIGAQAEPNYLQECIKFSVANRLDNIKFLQATPNYKTVDKLYQLCDILVLASIAEGLPLVILEALSANKPIVATPVGGVKGVLGEYESVKVLSDINFTTVEIEIAIKQQLEKNFDSRQIWFKSFNKNTVCDIYNNLFLGLL